MSRHAYRMEVERFRFAIATKDVEAALFAGSADMVLWHEEDGGPGYMEAFYTEGDGEEPFSQNAVVQHAGTIAEWWLGERWKGRLNQSCQIVPVIHILDKEIVLGSDIRRAKNHFLQQSFAGLRHLDIEVVVTDQAEKDTVAVNAIIPHHLLHDNLPGAGALVHDELYIIFVTSHNNPLFKLF